MSTVKGPLVWLILTVGHVASRDATNPAVDYALQYFRFTCRQDLQ